MKDNKIITLCGSTRFKEDFIRVQRDLTLKGHVVLCPCCYEHSGDKDIVNQDTKQILIDVHRRMIDLCDVLFVINKDKYIGESTNTEIQYARDKNKQIVFLEEEESAAINKVSMELGITYNELSNILKRTNCKLENVNNNTIIKDIKLLETCKTCGEHITLMASINVETGKNMLVKRCLKCGNYPTTEVAEIK